jgi:hypothetical protein
MEDLSEIVQKYINEEKRILIKRLCHNEVCLINKENELIQKYIDDEEQKPSKKKIKLSDEFENMDFLTNDSDQAEDLIEPIKVLNINNNSEELDIEALTHKLKNMSLKEIQKMCQSKNIEIFKKSESSGKTVKKTKKELVDILTSNS